MPVAENPSPFPREYVWLARAREAVARAGSGAVLDRWSAARLHAMAGGPSTSAITVAIPRSRNRPTHTAGIDVLRADVPVGDRRIVDGIPTTSELRTVVDCARFGDRVCAVSIIESGVRQGLVDLGDVADALEALTRARGLGAARSALALVDSASESPLETAVRLVLLDAGLPRPLVQQPFSAAGVCGRIDLAYPAGLLGAAPGGRYLGLAIEADGRMYHDGGSAAFDHDRVHHTVLEEAGWLVRRFTDRHARQQSEYVVATVRRGIETVCSGWPPSLTAPVGNRLPTS